MKKNYYYFTRLTSMLSFIEDCLKNEYYYKSINVVCLNDELTNDPYYRVELKYN